MRSYDFSQNRIRELREENALTQHEVSRKTGISQANLSRWEANLIVPNVLDCWKLADFFGVSVDYLIGKESD